LPKERKAPASALIGAMTFCRSFAPMSDTRAQLRAVLVVAIAAIAAAFAVHVTARLSEILTILEGMK